MLRKINEFLTINGFYISIIIYREKYKQFLNLNFILIEVGFSGVYSFNVKNN